MRIQIRRGVFETNSSSTHSLIMCKQSDWDNFMCGKMIMKGFPYNPEIVTSEGVNPADIFDDYVYDENHEYVVSWPENFIYMSSKGWNNVEGLSCIEKTFDDVKAVSIYYEEE